MTRTICLIRHGATAHNQRGIFMGTLDIPLSREGVQQAMTLREALAGRCFEAVYCSPLLRAYQTALIALRLATPAFTGSIDYELTHLPPRGDARPVRLIVDPRLAERSLGDLQGQVRADCQRLWPKYEGRNVTMSFHDRPDGGESFTDLQRRVAPFLESLGGLEPGQTVAVFAHNGPLRIIERLLLGLTEEQTLKRRFDNCELRELELEGRSV